MKSSLLAIIESPAGGEEVAAKALLGHLDKYFRIITIAELTSYSNSLPSKKILPYLRWLLSSILRSTQILITHRVASVVYTTTFTAALSAAMLRPFGAKNLYFHYHGNRIPEVHVLKKAPSLSDLRQFCTSTLKHHLVWLFHYLAFLRVRHVFTANQEAKKYLLENFPSIQSISMLQNGVDISTFTPPTREKKMILRKKFGIPSTNTVYLILSRLEPKKNIIQSIRYYQSLTRKNKNSTLLLAYPKHGNTPEYVNEVLKTASPISSKKILHNHKKIEEAYQVADYMINHAYQETSQLTILEALSCGVRIIGHTGLTAVQKKHLCTYEEICKYFSWEKTASLFYQKVRSRRE